MHCPKVMPPSTSLLPTLMRSCPASESTETAFDTMVTEHDDGREGMSRVGGSVDGRPVGVVLGGRVGGVANCAIRSGAITSVTSGTCEQNDATSASLHHRPLWYIFIKGACDVLAVCLSANESHVAWSLHSFDSTLSSVNMWSVDTGRRQERNIIVVTVRGRHYHVTLYVCMHKHPVHISSRHRRLYTTPASSFHDVTMPDIHNIFIACDNTEWRILRLGSRPVRHAANHRTKPMILLTF